MTTVTVSDFGATGRRTPRLDAQAISAGVLVRFRQVVEAQPETPAVVDGLRALTYRELAGEAAGVLRSLRDVLGNLGASGFDSSTPGPAPVAMLCGHDAAAVATVFGVLASGHPLLVLDARTPVPRLRSFVERAGVQLVLSDPANAAAAAEFDRPILVLGADARPVADAADLWCDPPGVDEPAILSFTSGSTGLPKIVEISQRQLVGDAWDNSTAGDCYDEADVVAHTLPMAFNAGICVTTAGPLVGATMVMYDVRGSGVAGLPEWLAQNLVSVMHSSPAILRAFVEAGPQPELIAGVRSLTVAGETVHGRDVEAARRLFSPELTVYNRYGSSETGLISEFVLRPGQPTPEGPLPAGTPVGTTRVTLLTDDGSAVAGSAFNDAVARGPGTVVVHREHLANGYLGNPEGTAAAFGTDGENLRTFRSSDLGRFDEDGRLVLLGRRDDSVKIRGYLVEPGEVDAVLHGLPLVREAVVVGRPRPGDEQYRLVAYVVSSDSQLNGAKIRAALRESLPAHMIPEAVVFLTALPRTERGKLDRSALPEPPSVVPSSKGQALSDWEQIVADAMAGALSLDDIGLDDDFFELGGDSLTAEQVMTTMTGELGVTHPEATATLLVQAPTVRQLAARLIRTPGPGSDVLIPIQPDGDRSPLFAIAGAGGLALVFLQLARHLGNDQPLYGLQARGLERRSVPDWTVEAMARRYVRHIREVQPEGPYRLTGHSFGGLVTMEVAHQLRTAGQEVELLIIMDSFPPEPEMLERVDSRTLKQKLGSYVDLFLTGLRGEQGEQYERFFRQSNVLQRRYTGKAYGGKTLILLADSEQGKHEEVWGKFLTGEWSAVNVPGDHFSMLREPYIAVTAEVIRKALDSRP